MEMAMEVCIVLQSQESGKCFVICIENSNGNNRFLAHARQVKCAGLKVDGSKAWNVLYIT